MYVLLLLMLRGLQNSQREYIYCSLHFGNWDNPFLLLIVAL